MKNILSVPPSHPYSLPGNNRSTPFSCRDSGPPSSHPPPVPIPQCPAVSLCISSARSLERGEPRRERERERVKRGATLTRKNRLFATPCQFPRPIVPPPFPSLTPSRRLHHFGTRIARTQVTTASCSQMRERLHRPEMRIQGPRRLLPT
jgi:hypothetical protein